MAKELNSICDPNTYESVFNEHAKNLKRFLYFKFNDLSAAEDVLQETFIKLWDSCKEVTLEKVKSYLYTIANNKFLNIKKHEKVIRAHEEFPVSDRTNESPEFLIIEEEFLEKIEKAIADLPEKQREVFLLSRIEKMKYSQIAEQLSISKIAVEKRMHNALKVMRSKIGNI